MHTGGAVNCWLVKWVKFDDVYLSLFHSGNLKISMFEGIGQEHTAVHGRNLLHTCFCVHPQG